MCLIDVLYYYYAIFKTLIWDEQASHLAAFDKAVTIGPRGYARINGEIVTKHDPEISGHRNTQKVMYDMPLTFPSGSTQTTTVPLSNKIYNELRKSAYKGIC